MREMWIRQFPLFLFYMNVLFITLKSRGQSNESWRTNVVLFYSHEIITREVWIEQTPVVTIADLQLEVF